MADRQDEHATELLAERSVNSQYLEEVKRRIAAGQRAAETAITSQNQQWTGSGPRPVIRSAGNGPLIGRVALAVDDEYLGTGFYIGSGHQETEGFQVVSWAAPVASLFFAGPESSDVLAGAVTARRSFVPDQLDIVDFVDDVDRPTPDGRKPFGAAVAATLAVPKAPRPASRPRAAERGAEGTNGHRGVSARPSAPIAAKARRAKRPDVDQPALSRAEAAVRRAIERPRTGGLGSVLATLQPNQYRLVTWPANEALVVQGHPGTGKTIVATHRAAYLAHPEREDGVGPLRVALLGPTSSYVEHVGAAMKALDAGDVDVFSVSGLLRRLGGQDAEPGRLGSSEADSARELWQLAATATDHVRRAGELGSGSYGEQVRRVAQAVIDRSHGLMSMPVPTEIDAWMSRLTIAAVLTEARFAPFLAAIGLAVRPWPDSERYDHIIIDEAQDLLPLEWQVVLALCRQEASVTILGDLNQRRSEFGVRSWSSLAAGLGIARSAAHFAPEVIDVGFRSTARILQFANQLLPREQRFVRSLRSGNPPTVRRVRREDVLRVAIDEATDVASRHASGLTAVIAMTNQAVADELRRRRWRRAGPLRWRLSGQTLVVLHPEEARGLEFDGVVVIEPRLFPESNGRQGLLYTSLTRATKELVVVHSQPLPSGLRPPRKRSST